MPKPTYVSLARMGLKKSTLGWLIAAFLLAAALSIPAYRGIRQWRADAMAEKAERLLSTPETISRAWELAHAARSLSPDDPEIARILARVYSASDPASAHTFWQKVVELSGGAAEDRLQLAKSYLRAALWEEFNAELAAQREDGLHPRQLDYLQAQAATLQGNYEQALKMAAALVAKANAPHEADKLFFQLTRLAKDPAVRRAGIDHLWKIAGDAGPRQEEALETLARLPDIELPDVARLIETIDRRENNSRDMRLLAAELRLALPDADPRSIYQRASQLFELDEPAELSVFGRWLNQHGLHRYTREAIPEETATKRQDLFLIFLDAMALNDEWEALRQLLDRTRIPVEDYLREFFLTRTFIELGDPRRARLAWDRALVAAARESPALYYLAKKARQLELPEFEVAALQRVVESPEIRQSAMKDLIAVFQRQGQTTQLRATLEKYVRYFPGDESAANDARYLGFLTEESAPGSLAQAQQLLKAQPAVLAYRMTLVLGLLRENRSAEALGLLMELPVNWFEVRDRWRLLAALALYREGFEKDARTLAAQVTRANLLPEEVLFLGEIHELK